MTDNTTQQNTALATTLAPKQLKTIELLLSGFSVSDVATLVGVDRSSIYRWMNEDESFVKELEDAKTQQLYDLREGLHSLAEDAVESLRELMNDRMVEAEIRLKVALLVLNAVAKRETGMNFLPAPKNDVLASE